MRGPARGLRTCVPPRTGERGGVRVWRLLMLAAGIAFGSGALTAANVADAGAPTASQWNGFTRLDFKVADRACILVVPAQPAEGRPWIWRTEFFGHEPQADLALLARGWHVAYMDAKNMYGGPKAMELFGRFYAHEVVHHRLASRKVMAGFSRGGLYAMNFAASHPNRVAAIYLDAPVLDIRSWPGKKRESKEWRECLEAYGLTEESLVQFRGNPIDRLRLIAGARVPILSVCGDADKVVPLAENTAVLEQRYRELGGVVRVILKPGVDHHPHSLKDPAPIVDWILANAKF